jgi:hypothetical protein
MVFRKKHVLTTIFLALFSTTVFASGFCDGFQRGYIVGYKQAKGVSLPPLPPLCPLKPLKGFGDPASDYEFGYTIGFKKGLAAGY